MVRRDPHLVNGLMRVKVDASRAEAELRRAPADGRLIVSYAGRSSHRALHGVSYQLLADSAEEQFAELLTVFGLHRAVESGQSRCGICNAVAWITLQPHELHGRVPRDVLRAGSEFYQCGSCRQIFWPGEKYNSTIQDLKDLVAGRGDGKVASDAAGRQATGERVVRGGRVPFDSAGIEYSY
jgi:uncharacterized protein with PIN domain